MGQVWYKEGILTEKRREERVNRVNLWRKNRQKNLRRQMLILGWGVNITKGSA
jgi:hypothetical protein